MLLFSCMIIDNDYINTAYAQDQSRKFIVQIDGLPVNFDAQIINNYTMVPFRPLAEALNIKIDWDNNTQTISGWHEENSIKLQALNKTAYYNNSAISLETPPININGKTLIPLRFFSETFNCNVKWDSDTNTIKITSPPKAMTTIGFYALGDSTTSSWENIFQQTYPETSQGNTDVLKELALGWYSMDEKGNLLTSSITGWVRPEGWENVLAATNKYHLNCEMVVHLTDHNSVIFNLLTNESAITNAITDITKEAKLYDGVNLNFEGLGMQNKNTDRFMKEKEGFTNFVNLLSQTLRQNNLKLTLTLHAPNSAYKGYDYESLGKYADRIIIMAHDYGSKPEPINLVLQAVETATELVPAEKLALGISIPSETPESIVTKIGIAKRYNLNGISLWRLGLVTDDMWNSIRSSTQSTN